MGEMLLAIYLLDFDWIFISLAVNEDNHNISDEFEFRPDSSKDCGAS